ncbi:asparaginase [Paenibacillus thalictri]|uniref:Asparaginase n=1 Tax=Paenibacillus thalictri TaxID=2527873 RepID=A0A4Q9DSE0_9BACL|nr:asparaginase [Paenibacillus thalictri]TBL78316.1 asparaginase [Paenibacillus thalictri]
MNRSEIVAHVVRGPIVESKHHGHLAVVDHRGHVKYAVGQPDVFTFIRSTAKPLQAISVVESGAARGLAQQQIALLCASHGGEPGHTEAAHAILASLGLTAEALTCGAHEPFHAPTAAAMRARGECPTALHNNCSGKHAGMLALAAMYEADIGSYASPNHPVQLQMRKTVADMCEFPEDRLALGTDGCGVPVFGMPLDRLARAYARFGQPDDLGSSRVKAINLIKDAICNYPYFIAGTGRFDTKLIEVTQGRIIGKMGAEGVFALTCPDANLGLAVKIEDGSERALYPVVMEALIQLDMLKAAEIAELQAFHTPKVTNWKGTEVGAILPQFQLRQYAP